VPSQITRQKTQLAKGRFILYDKMTSQSFPNSTWTFLYNPEQIINKISANVNPVYFSGQNWPAYFSNGVKEEMYSFTLILTGDSIQNGTGPVNNIDATNVSGQTTIKITPAVSSDVGSSVSQDVPNIFAEFGKRNMVYHIEHLKSLILRDPGRDWRILFNYGNIIPGGSKGFPNVFLLNNITATHTFCTIDLNETILASVDIELLVDHKSPVTRRDYLSVFKQNQPLKG